MLNPLTEAELKAFRWQCQVEGRNPDDFTLKVWESAVPHGAQPHRVVTVSENRVARCYRDGVTSWIYQFAEDLGRGLWVQKNLP